MSLPETASDFSRDGTGQSAEPPGESQREPSQVSSSREEIPRQLSNSSLPYQPSPSAAPLTISTPPVSPSNSSLSPPRAPTGGAPAATTLSATTGSHDDQQGDHMARESPSNPPPPYSSSKRHNSMFFESIAEELPAEKHVKRREKRRRRRAKNQATRIRGALSRLKQRSKKQRGMLLSMAVLITCATFLDGVALIYEDWMHADLLELKYPALPLDTPPITPIFTDIYWGLARFVILGKKDAISYRQVVDMTYSCREDACHFSEVKTSFGILCMLSGAVCTGLISVILYTHLLYTRKRFKGRIRTAVMMSNLSLLTLSAFSWIVYVSVVADVIIENEFTEHFLLEYDNPSLGVSWGLCLAATVFAVPPTLIMPHFLKI